MPIKIHHVNGRYFYQYGRTGAKFYFNPKNDISMHKAFHRCMKQVAAIHVRQR